MLRPCSPRGVDGPVPAGAGYDVTWWRQATSQQPTPSWAAPVAPEADYLWGPTYVNGVEQLVDVPTTPLGPLDLKHVALSAQGEWLHHPDPIVDYSPGEDLEVGVLFLYLQLHPPHCSSCTCH